MYLSRMFQAHARTGDYRMTWGTWIKLFGKKADDLSVHAIVHFRRGNRPELGKIMGEGNELRVPVKRCDEDGSISNRRTYWRSRSQIYVR